MESTGRVHLQIKGEKAIASGISVTGNVRPENQDTIYLDEEGRFFLLADGMGGHEKGAEASQQVIEVLRNFLQFEKLTTEKEIITNKEGVPSEILSFYPMIEKGIERVNKVIYERNLQEGLQRYMGSTLVGIVHVSTNHLVWFNIGDSRLYRWRPPDLNQLTNDHSVHAEWYRQGRIGMEPAKNIVTRAIGPKKGVVPDINWEACRKGDTYILCSDGLSDMISDKEISDILKNIEDVDTITVKLLEAALAAGGKDNVSVVVCRV